MKLYEYIFVFLTGNFLYSMTEILYRGYTHWSMTLLGGICLAGIYFIKLKFTDLNYFIRLWLEALWITCSEFLCGVTVNIILKWNVWDYSNIWGNLFGQTCILYTILWYLICIPSDFICGRIYKRFNSSII